MLYNSRWKQEFHFIMLHDTRKNMRIFREELKRFIRKYDRDVTEKDLNKSIRYI